MSDEGKITIARDALHSAMTRIVGVAAKSGKNIIPILRNVRIECRGDAIALSTTDLGRMMETVVTATAPAQGVITVDAHLLTQLAGDFPAGAELVIEWTGGSQAVVRCGRSRFKLNALPAADFPDPITVDDAALVTLPAATLRKALASVAYAISTEATRHYLCGVYLHRHKGAVRFTATDAHRMAMVTLTEKAADFPGVIIPQDVVSDLLRTIDAKSDEEIELQISPAAIGFRLGPTTLRSRLVDGTYPDYVRVIPGGNDKVAQLDLDDLAARVKRIDLLNRSNQGRRALKFAFAAGDLTVSAVNEAAGEGEEMLTAEQDEPFTLEIGFNGEYLKDMFEAIGTDLVRVKMADPGSPALFEGVGRSDALFLLMPLRV